MKITGCKKFATSSIKDKLAGCDGDLNQLLVKARFEEAKIRDLSSKGTTSVPRSLVLTPERASTPAKVTPAGGKQAHDHAN